MRILPAIEPGLDPDTFYQTLIVRLEKASDELLVETVEANPHLKLPPTAAKRLAELQQEQANATPA